MKRVLFPVIAFVLAACATEVLSTWKKPGAAPATLQNVVVIVKTKDEGMRRSAEDQIAAKLAPRHAVPSYQLAPDVQNTDAVLGDAIKKGGFDGAVAVRVESVKKEVTPAPGPWVGPYYGFGGFAPYDPGMVNVDTYVRVETNIYALPQQDLIWSATTRTMDPTGMNDLIDETIAAVGQAMKAPSGTSTMPVSVR
jgi:hypothetical protein